MNDNYTKEYAPIILCSSLLPPLMFNMLTTKSTPPPPLFGAAVASLWLHSCVKTSEHNPKNSLWQRMQEAAFMNNHVLFCSKSVPFGINWLKSVVIHAAAVTLPVVVVVRPLPTSNAQRSFLFSYKKLRVLQVKPTRSPWSSHDCEQEGQTL